MRLERSGEAHASPQVGRRAHHDGPLLDSSQTRLYFRHTVVNKAILIGNLGKDPEVRFTPSGQAVAKFSVATNEKWKDQQGQLQERTEWHNIVVWGKQAEACGQYLAKGRQVFVEGRIQNRSYDDKDGNKKYITEIVAQNVRFLGGGGRGGGGEGGVGLPQGEDSGPSNDDDIPF